MPEPKTRAELALEEIKAILVREDLAGIVQVQDEESLAFLHKIDPKWSCCKYEAFPQGMGVRIRALASEFPSKEEHMKCIERTFGMLMAASNQAENTYDELGEILAMLIAKFPDVVHVEKRRS